MASACLNNIGVSPEYFLDPSNDHGDFEFRLDDPVTMLPADELFSDGKLVPLQFTSATKGLRSPESEIAAGDPYLQSPKAIRCSTRWRELLGFRKNKPDLKSTTSPSNSTNSIRQFLHRTSKSISSKDSDCDSSSISISSSSRRSLSSSSSSHDLDDLPRPSLDKNPSRPQIRLPRSSSSSQNQNQIPRHHHRARSVNPSISAESPRMSSSGKIVFQSLERSASSPSSFNGGPRYRHRGIERSYSANVRISPVLNVSICSKSGLFGFGQMFSNGGTRSSKNPSTATTGIVRR